MSCEWRHETISKSRFFFANFKEILFEFTLTTHKLMGWRHSYHKLKIFIVSLSVFSSFWFRCWREVWKKKFHHSLFLYPLTVIRYHTDNQFSFIMIRTGKTIKEEEMPIKFATFCAWFNNRVFFFLSFFFRFRCGCLAFHFLSENDLHTNS